MIEGYYEEGESNAAPGAVQARGAGGCSVRMWGYLPAASPQRAPLLQPVAVPATALNDPLATVCNGGCGFGIAISESGKLNTWGSTTELGQCYLISGKQQEVPEPYPLPTDSPIVQAAGGWAHCVAVTGGGEVYTWGWSECVPSLQPTAKDGKDGDGGACTSTTAQLSPSNCANVVAAAPAPAPAVTPSSRLRSALAGGSPRSGSGSKQTAGRQAKQSTKSPTDTTRGVEGIFNTGTRKRKTVSFKDEAVESPDQGAEENAFAPPCLVNLNPGIKIKVVAAGGRHTLALSDVGHLWGWGYGGEGQLGLGSRMRVVSSPQHIPCFSTTSESGRIGGAPPPPPPGSYITAIACGGRHSAVVTDAGALLTFGWGLHGQVGQGGNEDELRPCGVATMEGLHIVGIAAGLWHTLCITESGDAYAFGGNQFGQLGVGGNSAEMTPRLIDAPLLGGESSVAVACGARHSVVLTGSGKIFAWGWNKYGQLGLGDVNNRDLPVQVTMNDGGRAASVACGWWHTLAAVHIR